MLNNGHILSAQEMQHAEQVAIDAGTSVGVLMDRAGSGAAQLIWRISHDWPTLVLCGPGNNGGDGYVIAQWLLEKGVDVRIAQWGEPKTGAAVRAQSLWKGETQPATEAQPAKQFVDCLFGTGLTRAIEGPCLEHYSRLAEGASRKIAIDLPSGVDSDTGLMLNQLPEFDVTIALGAYKPSHFLQPACSAMGNVIGSEIGIEQSSTLELIDRPELDVPAFDDHKYSRGLVAVVAGSMAGAAQMTAMAAQKSGAGYVKLFARKGMVSPNSSIVVEQFETEEDLRSLLSDSRIGSVVIGPGLGLNAQAQSLLEAVLDSQKPLVLDADALVLLGRDYAYKLQSYEHPIVATPHQGEFDKICSNRSDPKLHRVREFACKSNTVMLLKGADTIISNVESSTAISRYSCGWLSTAGTGDVLSGIIAARLAVDSNAFKAAQDGQWLHNRAARLAGPSFTPEMLIDQIPVALEECL